MSESTQSVSGTPLLGHKKSRVEPLVPHRWAFICADGSLFAWEQGMVAAERAATAAGADQNYLRFDHPTMEDELESMGPSEGGAGLGRGCVACVVEQRHS